MSAAIQIADVVGDIDNRPKTDIDVDSFSDK